MNLLQIAIKSSRLIRTADPNPPLLRCVSTASYRHFSTGAQSPPPPPPPTQQPSAADPFFQTPQSGLFYGKLSGTVPTHGITKHTLKSDVIRILEDTTLSPDDLKFHYDWRYEPTGVIIQFTSHNAYDAAFRQVRRNRLFRLDKADRSNWDNTRPYDGKFVLLQGLPRNAQVDDIDRFLSGSEHDPSSLQFIVRQDSFPNAIRMAIVRFPSATLAMDAFITKNRGFCLNNQILMQVLH